MSEAIEAETLATEAKPIEHWQAKHSVPRWLHLGAARWRGWGVGRELDEKTYLSSVEAFASRPVEA